MAVIIDSASTTVTGNEVQVVCDVCTMHHAAPRVTQSAITKAAAEAAVVMQDEEHTTRGQISLATRQNPHDLWHLFDQLSSEIAKSFVVLTRKNEQRKVGEGVE